MAQSSAKNLHDGWCTCKWGYYAGYGKACIRQQGLELTESISPCSHTHWSCWPERLDWGWGLVSDVSSPWQIECCSQSWWATICVDWCQRSPLSPCLGKMEQPQATWLLPRRMQHLHGACSQLQMTDTHHRVKLFFVVYERHTCVLR